MTTTLVAKSCVPCRGGIPPLKREEAEQFLAQTPDWSLVADGTKIERVFRFANFKEALDFVVKVGELAEAQSHHPDVEFGWGYCRVGLQTKKIKGLHENDFILAAKIDAL